MTELLFTLDVGTTVDHRLLAESHVVFADVAVEENVMTAFATGKLYA